MPRKSVPCRASSSPPRTPFTADGVGRRRADPGRPGRSADRRRRARPGALWHHRRVHHAQPRGVPPGDRAVRHRRGRSGSGHRRRRRACPRPGAIDLARHAEQVGADAIMLVPPFYDPLSFETLKVFLADVAESISLPIVYYNVPGATGIRLTADQIAELGRDRRRRLPQGHLGRRGRP